MVLCSIMYSTMKKRNGDSCFVYPQLSHHIIIRLLTARFPSTHADKSYSFSRHLKSHSQGFQRQTAEKKGKRQKKTDGREEIKAFRVLCKFLIDQRVIHCLIVPRKMVIFCSLMSDQRSYAMHLPL